MNHNTWISIVLIIVACTLPGCGGGSNVVSNSTDGTLSIEHVLAPTTADGQGAVSVNLIAPAGGPGTGTVTISSGNTSLVVFSPASQSVNSNGDATFYYTAKEVESNTVVPFTITVGSLSITKQITIYGTGALNITISLPSSADTYGTISAAFAGGAQTAGRKIAISSDRSANIALDTTEQPADSDGKTVFFYRVIGITSDTTITFTAKSDSQSVSRSILIPVNIINPEPPPPIQLVSAIAAVSTSPTHISIKGTGGFGRTETSIVTFIVRDSVGLPIANQIVDFTLDTSFGGITLVPFSATSDSAGIVKTIVNAGIVSTPLHVTASVRGKSISAKSDQLIISTGLPHQDGLSVSSSSANPEALGYDGLVVPVTAMLSDHFGNPAPDGTVVYFSTYGGSIEPFSSTVNGIATVDWRSQNPRPADGKAKIMAYCLGEESFTDINGNGLADPGEFTDIPEPFLSISGQTIRDAAVDPFIDYNGDGIYNAGDGKFNGVLQGNAFSGAARSLYVFKNVQITMSGSNATILPSALVIAQNSSTNVTLTITDENMNSLPEKTTIAFYSTTGGCSSGKGLTVSPASKTINNTGSQITFTTTLTNACLEPGIANLFVSVKTPKGIETIKEISVNY